LGKFGFPKIEGARFYLPARIAFEPDAETEVDRLGVDAALHAIRSAWSRGQPAIVSTHRANYVQLDPARGAHALDRLRGLLARLAEERATFLTDAEVHALVTSGRSRRAIGARVAVEREGAAAEWRPA